MKRATTPTHTFKLPFDCNGCVDKVRITYMQHCGCFEKGKRLEKTEKEIKIHGDTLTLTLTQDDTKIFVAGRCVKVQVRILTTDGKSLASDICTIPVEDVLNDEVL